MVAGKALCKSCTLLQMGLISWWSTASGSGRWSKQAFIKRATSNFAYASTAALVPYHRGQTAVAVWASQGNPTLHYSHSSDFSFQSENSWKKQECPDPPVSQPFASAEYCEINRYYKDSFFTFCGLQSGKHGLGADEQALPEQRPPSPSCFLFMLCQLGLAL